MNFCAEGVDRCEARAGDEEILVCTDVDEDWVLKVRYEVNRMNKVDPLVEEADLFALIFGHLKICFFNFFVPPG